MVAPIMQSAKRSVILQMDEDAKRTRRRAMGAILRPQTWLKKSHRIGDRLGANRRIKSHRITGCRGDASAEAGRIERLRLAVDEQRRRLPPEQDQRTFFVLTKSG